jgi:hypothetical protein
VAVVMVGFGVASAPASAASAPRALKSTSVSLQSSYAAVRSSTKQSLNVVVEASNNPSTPANDTLVVALAKGPVGDGESHDWSFPISASVLRIGPSGAGTLDVPAKSIQPFGAVSLKIEPVGKVTSKSCQGTVTSKSVKVSLSGVFYFDTASTGSHKWGTVGSKKSFSFPATNAVTWLFSSAASENCIATSTPCEPSTTWAAADAHGVSFDGEATNNDAGVVRASRAATLSTPHGAVRDDSNVGQTTQPSLTSADADPPVLSVSGAGGVVTGTATIAGSMPATQISTPCGKDGSELTHFFTGRYTNSSPPLKVTEEIYGTLTLGTNNNATVEQTTGL